MKNQLKKIPLIGSAGRSMIHALRKLGRTLRNQQAEKYNFVRLDTASQANPDQARVINLLNYTKTSESAYNAEDFPAAYHSIVLKDLNLRGQRDPMERINLVPLDFEGKTVLDIGCNQGGMLFSISGKIAHGVGIDYDSRLVNAANKIRSYANISNVDFYVFNLEDENLDLISDFLPTEKVDVAFLLAVCMWIENWKEVIQFAKKVSTALLFESNGKSEQQLEQLEYLRSIYSKVDLISAQSQEDSLQKKRKLYFCQ
jgi:SAM-dependent methyltransferase